MVAGKIFLVLLEPDFSKIYTKKGFDSKNPSD